MTEKEIRDLFASKNVALGRDDVWRVQQALVIKHSALERLAAEMGISFEAPKIIRAERDEAVILATGRIFNEGSSRVVAEEWSIGEALIGANYRVSGKQAAYVYAMAEKRAKDRVILKLAKLHGAYSEEEADAFRPGKAEAPLLTYEELEEVVTNAMTLDAYKEIMAAEKASIDALSDKEKADLRKVCQFKVEALKKFGEAA